MKTHLMLDFETLGKTPRSRVFSLGAVLFTREDLLAKRYWLLNPDLQPHRPEDEETVMWWEKQGDEAKAVINEAKANGISLDQFAQEFMEFCDGHGGHKMRVWANSAGFDVPIIVDILNGCERETPWKFWNDRCYRTLKSIGGPEFEKEIPKPEIKHHALEDAIFQARAVARYLSRNPEHDR